MSLYKKMAKLSNPNKPRWPKRRKKPTLTIEELELAELNKIRGRRVC